MAASFLQRTKGRSCLDLSCVPNLLGDCGNRLEFAPLLFFGQGIAASRGRKVALRAERKLLHGHVVRSLVDLPQYLVLRLQIACLVVIRPSTTIFPFGM
jgi:hypothetical protein